MAIPLRSVNGHPTASCDQTVLAAVAEYWHWVLTSLRQSEIGFPCDFEIAAPVCQLPGTILHSYQACQSAHSLPQPAIAPTRQPARSVVTRQRPLPREPRSGTWHLWLSPQPAAYERSGCTAVERQGRQKVKCTEGSRQTRRDGPCERERSVIKIWRRALSSHCLLPAQLCRLQ